MNRKTQKHAETLMMMLYDPDRKINLDWEWITRDTGVHITALEAPEATDENPPGGKPHLIILHEDHHQKIRTLFEDSSPRLFVYSDNREDEAFERAYRLGASQVDSLDSSSMCLKRNLASYIKRIQLEEQIASLDRRLEYATYNQHLISHIATSLNGIQDFSREILNLLDVLLFSIDLDLIIVNRAIGTACGDGKSDFIIRSKADDHSIAQKLDMTNFNKILNTTEIDSQIVLHRSTTKDQSVLDALQSIGIESINMCPLQTRKCLLGSILFATRKETAWNSEMNDLFMTVSSLIANTWEKDMSIYQRIDAQAKLTESVRMVEQASKMASLGIMSAGITHEINQPLSAIKVTAESIQLWADSHPGELPEKFIKRIGMINQSASRIDKIIRHMRTNWISATPDELVNIEVNEAIKDALTLLEKQAESHGIDLFLQFDQKKSMIQGVNIQFEQIIVNLIINAIHALDDVDRSKKILTISTRKREDIVIITVEDNGTGFTPEVLRSMFEPFFTTKSAGKGSGLGLAIVKNFVLKFNGSIQAENVPEGGARFIIELPIKQ